MKKISTWGRQHKYAARIIIVLLFIVLTALGIITGSLSNALGIIISSWVFVITVGIYFIAVLIYPAQHLKKNRLSRAAFYVRQKTCDIGLAASTFVMIIYFANQPGRIFHYSQGVQSALGAELAAPKDSTVKHKTVAVFSASMKDATGNNLKWKEKKKLLKAQIKAVRKSDLSRGAKVALIILSVLVALGLLALIGALACELSCGGSEGAAILVLSLGSAAVLLLFLLVIKSITGKKRKKHRDERPDNPGQ
jgi:hypothetical protein